MSLAFQQFGSSDTNNTSKGSLTATDANLAGSSPSSIKSTPVVIDIEFSELTVKYQPPPPPYPLLAKLAKIQGIVIVEIIIGQDGIPIRAVTIEGPAQLRTTAEKYAMQWKFNPAMLGGIPHIAKFQLNMPFVLKG